MQSVVVVAVIVALPTLNEYMICSWTHLNVCKDTEVSEDPIAYLVIREHVNIILTAAPCWRLKESWTSLAI